MDSLGEVLNHLTYEAFGRVTSETNAAVDFLFAFTDREWDRETDLYYYRARYYDSALGRFLSEDPLGFAAGDGNLARYVANDPVTRRDPSGRSALDEWNLLLKKVYVGIVPGVNALLYAQDHNSSEKGDTDQRARKDYRDWRDSMPWWWHPGLYEPPGVDFGFAVRLVE